MRKIALITGATDGIGKALAFKLVKESYTVSIIGRNAEKVNATVAEIKNLYPNSEIFGIKSDLSKLSEVKRTCETFLQNYSNLDVLVLNANAIANERIITEDGNEQNFAIGYLSRVLMIERLEKILENTPNSQIISVIGLDTSRIDFRDISIEKDFTGRKGLTRWQWAINLYTTHHNQHKKTPMNLYMPGLVKTKILKNEPQPMRLFVQIMNVIIGLTPEKASENLFKVMNEINAKKIRNALFSYAKQRKPLTLATQAGDTEKLLKLTEDLIQKFI